MTTFLRMFSGIKICKRSAICVTKCFLFIACLTVLSLGLALIRPPNPFYKVVCAAPSAQQMGPNVLPTPTTPHIAGPNGLRRHERL